MRLLLCTLWSLAALAQQPPYLPLRDVRAGMKGYGLTVFSGEKIERFDVEVLGILENAGPKQAIILARLSGGPLANTGVMQGMSGSPVYLNGRLAGAVALAKEPIAGIRPFEEMLDESCQSSEQWPPSRRNRKEGAPCKPCVPYLGA